MDAQAPPHALLIELSPDGNFRLNGRETLWPHGPDGLLREFQATPVRRVLVRADRGVPVWVLHDSLRTLRRFATAAGSAAVPGYGRPLVLAASDRELALPERVPIHRWLVSRFLRRR